MDEKNNVLLIWPKADEGFYDFSPLNIIFGQKAQFPPLPLLTVAGELGDVWQYQLIDEQIQDLLPQHVESADFFLISANLLQKKSTEKIISLLRSYKKPIIIGGPLISTLPNIFSEDIITVEGEIESRCESSDKSTETVAQALSRDMKNNSLKKKYKAVGHPKLKNNSLPRYDLIDLSQYSNLTIQTSRGCHHSCDFCQLVPLYGRHQSKYISQIVNELDMLYKFNRGGGKTVYIIDDNFMGDINNEEYKREFKELLYAIKKWQISNNFPFDFFCQCSLELTEHEDLVELMAQVGINIIFIGIETTNQRVLALMNKKQNLVEDQVAKIKKLQSYGMGIFVGLIFGFDEDDESSIDNQIEFMRSSSVPIAGITLLQAPNGTKLYKRMLKRGRISKDPEVLTKSFRSNIILKKNPKEFYRQYLRFAKTVYDPKEYFKRCLIWIKGWNDAYVLPGKKGSIISNLSLVRFLRSFIQQGISSEYRLQYVKYIIYSMIEFRLNINKIALAFYLGYFFRMVYEDTKKIEEFEKNIPCELISEWYNYKTIDKS